MLSVAVLIRGFILTRMFSADDPEYAQGFRTILATEPCHDLVANWWPPGHTLGFEHQFHHGVVVFLAAIEKSETVTPNFKDGVEIMAILMLKFCVRLPKRLP
jgi:hypothetical protein